MSTTEVVQQSLPSTRELVRRARAGVIFGAGAAKRILDGGESFDLSSLKFLSTWISGHDGVPFMRISHPPMDLLEEKRNYFREIKPKIPGWDAEIDSLENLKSVKTVTLELEGKLVAVTGLGAHVTPEVRARIAEEFNVSSKTMKRSRINPDTIDTSVVLGLNPGVVAPFVPLDNAQRIDAWYYLEDASIPPTTPVEIATSRTGSLLLQKQHFDVLLTDYENDILTHGFFRRIDVEGISQQESS